MAEQEPLPELLADVLELVDQAVEGDVPPDVVERRLSELTGLRACTSSAGTASGSRSTGAVTVADWQRVRVVDGDVVTWLGPEDPFGSRPRVSDPALAEALSAEEAGRVLWAYRRAHAWRGYRVSTEDVEDV